MVSSVLGDGLLSQMVVNPLQVVVLACYLTNNQVADQMGINLDDLGINRTEAEKFGALDTSVSNSSGLFGSGGIFSGLRFVYFYVV